MGALTLTLMEFLCLVVVANRRCFSFEILFFFISFLMRRFFNSKLSSYPYLLSMNLRLVAPYHISGFSWPSQGELSSLDYAFGLFRYRSKPINSQKFSGDSRALFNYAHSLDMPDFIFSDLPRLSFHSVHWSSFSSLDRLAIKVFSARLFKRLAEFSQNSFSAIPSSCNFNRFNFFHASQRYPFKLYPRQLCPGIGPYFVDSPKGYYSFYESHSGSITDFYILAEKLHASLSRFSDQPGSFSSIFPCILRSPGYSNHFLPGSHSNPNPLNSASGVGLGILSPLLIEPPFSPSGFLGFAWSHIHRLIFTNSFKNSFSHQNLLPTSLLPPLGSVNKYCAMRTKFRYSWPGRNLTLGLASSLNAFENGPSVNFIDLSLRSFSIFSPFIPNLLPFSFSLFPALFFS